jgi:hypothetical protein
MIEFVDVQVFCVELTPLFIIQRVWINAIFFSDYSIRLLDKVVFTDSIALYAFDKKLCAGEIIWRSCETTPM